MAVFQPNGNEDLLRKNLLKAHKAYNDAVVDPTYKQVCGVVDSSDQLYERAAVASGLDLPQIRSAGGIAPTTDMYEAANLQIQGQKRMLQFRMLDEAFINDQVGLAKSAGTLLGSVFGQAKEIGAAVYLVGCLSSSLIATPWGQPASSAAHPLETGLGTNTFGTQQTLGIIALEQACTAMLTQYAHKGTYLKPCPPPYQLEVSATKSLVAERLTGADRFPTTPNNDPNPAKRLISRVVTIPYAYNTPYYWALRSVSDAMHGRAMLSRYGFKLSGPTYVEDNDSWKVTARENYAFYLLDWRGTYYSTPSS